MIGKTFTQKELEFFLVWQKRSLDLIERWLNENKFLCGNEISIADLSAACEIYQTKFIELDLSKWPKTKEWIKRVVEDDPIVFEIHKPMIKLAAVSVKKQKQ